MFRLWGGDEFLTHLQQDRVCYIGGRLGSGKTRTAVLLAYWLRERGLIDCLATNFPCAWAVPYSAASLRNCCYVVDECGVLFDARMFGNSAANQFRKTMVADLRKIGGYCLLPSKVAIDVSLRGLWLQRGFHVGGFEYWHFGLADNANVAVGGFWIVGGSWAWAYYDDQYVPSEGDIYSVVPAIQRSVAVASEGLRWSDAPAAGHSGILAYQTPELAGAATLASAGGAWGTS